MHLVMPAAFFERKTPDYPINGEKKANEEEHCGQWQNFTLSLGINPKNNVLCKLWNAK